MNNISKKIGLCICAVQLIASVVFFAALGMMNMLPAKYIGMIGAAACVCHFSVHTASF